MKFDHNLIYQGKWYRAGEEVPVKQTGASDPQPKADEQPKPKRKVGRPKKSES